MRNRLIYFWLAVSALTTQAHATAINTNDITAYNAFANGATLQNFENTGTLTAFALDSYAKGLNGLTAIPASAQVGGQFNGLHFHSGGGSFNNPTGNPGTPAALLALSGNLSTAPHSGGNVIGALDLTSNNQDILKLNAFVEIIFTKEHQNRIGFWLNPDLGKVLLTAFDENGNNLENVIGDAGNFVGISRNSNDIRFVSIVGQGLTGFTIDDLTYGRAAGNGNGGGSVPEPGLLWLGMAGLLAWHRCRRPTNSVQRY